jgi:hypothetical protein
MKYIFNPDKFVSNHWDELPRKYDELMALLTVLMDNDKKVVDFSDNTMESTIWGYVIHTEDCDESNN